MDCTVEYDALLHRWVPVGRWAKSPILDEQTLLHRSHGHAVLVLLTTWCLRTARFLCRLATRASSKAAMAVRVRHVERHCLRSSGTLTILMRCRRVFYHLVCLKSRHAHAHIHTHTQANTRRRPIAELVNSRGQFACICMYTTADLLRLGEPLPGESWTL